MIAAVPTRQSDPATLLRQLTQPGAGDTNSEQKHADPTGERRARVEPAWPALDPAALHGVAGEFVRLFAPQTEADPAAILAQFLVAFGSACGRAAYTYVGESRHGTNAFVATVGQTSRARKGTAGAIVARVMAEAAPGWAADCKTSGVGSGEAVIHAIRDASDKTGKEGEPLDSGVADKRLIIEEEEGASLFKVSGRDGAILSDNLRKAWDSPAVLRNAVKLSPAKATAPHVSVSTHITLEELRRVLTETDRANGLGNRFLWVCARRSQVLSNPKRMHPDTLRPVAAKVGAAIVFAQGLTGEVLRDAACQELWDGVYPMLTRDHPGMFGALTARAEAQVVRLSLIYAMLDRSRTITARHLAAGLAFWKYSEDSARHIFGDRIGDHDADRIRDALAKTPEGMTETTIHALFNRNVSAARIQDALNVLLGHGLVTMNQIDTQGRPARLWSIAARDAT